MTPSNTLEEKAAFDRFSDLMAKLMVKRGRFVKSIILIYRPFPSVNIFSAGTRPGRQKSPDLFLLR